MARRTSRPVTFVGSVPPAVAVERIHAVLGGPVGSAPDAQAERILVAHGLGPVAGLDEAGRGCLAGPVVAAAVMFDPEALIPGLDDSKKLTRETRENLAPLIREQALAYAIGSCSPQEIDRWNILRASLEAMNRALAGLSRSAGFVLIDGNRSWPGLAVPHATVVKGDGRCLSMAAASILAKTERDAIMRSLAARHPEYGWERNVGYPTPEHLAALNRYGVCGYHRASFRPVSLVTGGKEDLFGSHRSPIPGRIAHAVLT